MFDLPYRKAPGLDGYTVNFFKKCWSLIKTDLIKAIQQFYNFRGKHWHLRNSAHISLLPKIDEAMRIKDFRPISLMHMVGKIV